MSVTCLAAYSFCPSTPPLIRGRSHVVFSLILLCLFSHGYPSIHLSLSVSAHLSVSCLSLQWSLLRMCLILSSLWQDIDQHHAYQSDNCCIQTHLHTNTHRDIHPCCKTHYRNNRLDRFDISLVFVQIKETRCSTLISSGYSNVLLCNAFLPSLVRRQLAATNRRENNVLFTDCVFLAGLLLLTTAELHSEVTWFCRRMCKPCGFTWRCGQSTQPVVS